jgi:hypothetical protein
MALWGKADSLYSAGTVTVNLSAKTITGSGTSFTAVGISTGTVIAIGVGGTYGQAVISGITSATLVSIATTQYITGIGTVGLGATVGIAYTLSQKPIYTLEDTNYSGIQTTSPGLTNFIVGVDEYEAAAVSVASTTYKVAHAGWVGIHTYTDMHGNLRIKSEVLVAMSGISSNVGPTAFATGDANDDAIFPDRYITITTQPTAVVGIATTSATSLTVFGIATPLVGVSTAWFYAFPVGAGFTALSNGLIYSNVTGPVLGIAATTVAATRPNGYSFRAVVTAAGGATATSNIVTVGYST